jgi:hypothetical protein
MEVMNTRYSRTILNRYNATLGNFDGENELEGRE